MNWMDARSPKSVAWLIRGLAAGLTALVISASSASAQSTEQVAAVVVPAQLPLELRVPAGNRIAFVGHAVGTQNYVCLPAESGVKYVLFTPQATLASDDGRQIATHYFSPNPLDGTIRATWERSRDTSTVWGKVIGTTTDSDFVAQNAIAWLLIQPVAVQGGIAGGEDLTATTFVQRLNTSGGLAPSSGCASMEDVGQQAFVPYTADYVFYEAVSS
jgi:hypothetical protein